MLNLFYVLILLEYMELSIIKIKLFKQFKMYVNSLPLCDYLL